MNNVPEEFKPPTNSNCTGCDMLYAEIKPPTLAEPYTHPVIGMCNKYHDRLIRDELAEPMWPPLKTRTTEDLRFRRCPQCIGDFPNEEQPEVETSNVVAFKLANIDNPTVVDTLQKLIEEIEEGEVKGKRALLIVLDDEASEYSAVMRACNIKRSECLALLEVAKVGVLQAMEILP